MCAISIYSYDWDSGESEGKRPKPAPLQHMRLCLNIYATNPLILRREEIQAALSVYRAMATHLISLIALLIIESFQH